MNACFFDKDKKVISTDMTCCPGIISYNANAILQFPLNYRDRELYDDMDIMFYVYRKPPFLAFLPSRAAKFICTCVFSAKTKDKSAFSPGHSSREKENNTLCPVKITIDLPRTKE